MASLLEVFGILFESDADEVKKGADTAGKSVDDLEDKITDTDATTEKLGESFLDLTNSAKTAIASVLGAGALALGVINAAKQTDELGKFSQVLGLNIEDVNAWNEAIIRSGGSAQGFQGSVRSLTNQLTDFALTGGGEAAEVFARLGISAFDSAGQVRSAFNVLPEIADAFENLSAAEAVGFGQKLGLDQATILLLQQGRREVDELIRRQKELGTITKEDADIAAEFNNAWADTRQVFNRLFVTIGNVVLPIFTRVFDAVNEFVVFLRDNQVLVTGFFIGIAGTIAAVYLPAIISAAVATLATIAPFLAIAAAIAAAGIAFALIYEDIQAFIDGNDSLIGQFVNRYPVIGEVIGKLKQAFVFFADTIAEIFDAVLNIPNDVEGSFRRIVVAILNVAKTVGDVFFGIVSDIAGYFIDLLPASVDQAGDAMTATFDRVAETIKTIFSTLIDIVGEIVTGIGKGLIDSLPDITGLLDSAKELFGFDGSGAIELIKKGQQDLQAVTSNPLSGQSANSVINTSATANRSTHVSVGTVSVDARGGDSQDVANNVGTALSDQMQQAVSDFDDGVAA